AAVAGVHTAMIDPMVIANAASNRPRHRILIMVLPHLSSGVLYPQKPTWRGDLLVHAPVWDIQHRRPCAVGGTATQQAASQRAVFGPVCRRVGAPMNSPRCVPAPLSLRLLRS